MTGEQAAASQEFEVYVSDTYASQDCHGAAWLRAVPGGGNGTQATAWSVLGRDLPHGSRIRVTVEVLEETAPRTECVNPWHARNPRAYPHGGAEHRPERCLPIPAAAIERAAQRAARLDALHAAEQGKI